VTGVLALAWGALAALPFVSRARRLAVADRSSGVPAGRTGAATARLRALTQRFAGQSRALPRVLRVVRAPARSRAARRSDAEYLRELAVAVDLIGVGVAAGCTPYLAVEVGAEWSGPHIGRALRDVSHACALGQSFDDALRDLGARLEPVRPLTEALRTSARLGSPVAPALARLAVDVRADLRRRAEARARTVPVRLCFPLVGCVLPAFALLTVVPVVLDGLHR